MNKLPKCASILLLFVVFSAIRARGQNTPGAQKLTLREAVTLALQNSRDLKLARVQYRVALGEARVDRASFLPNVYTGGGYVYTYGFPSVPAAVRPRFSSSTTISLCSILCSRASNAQPRIARAAKRWNSTESAMT